MRVFFNNAQQYRLFFSLVLVTLMAPGSASAYFGELRIGSAKAINTLDPQRSNYGFNIAVTNLLFESIGNYDDLEKFYQPGLVVSETLVDADKYIWEYGVRKGVYFHDGSDLTARDIVASIERVRDSPSTAGSFNQYVANIKSAVVIDDYRFRVQVSPNYSELFSDFIKIKVLPSHLRKQYDDKGFINGESVIGSAPYQFQDYIPNQMLRLKRFDDHWQGPQSPWETVTIRFIPDMEERFQALLRGELDVAEKLLPHHISRLKKLGFGVFKRVTDRVIFLQLDTYRDVSPFITGHDGKPLTTNPLKDLRVRQAINLAIDRNMIIDKVLHQGAQPASQIFLPSRPFASRNLQVQKPNITKARRLLKEAGYPRGFRIRIHGPNGRYVNDVAVLEMVATMLNNIGVIATAETLPSNEFFTKALDQHAFSLNLLGWSPTTSAGYTFNGLFVTPEKSTGKGKVNSGRYSNSKLDELVRDAESTTDTAHSNRLYQLAGDMVMHDVAIIPLHFQMAIWGVRKGIRYVPRRGSYLTRPEMFFPEG